MGKSRRLDLSVPYSPTRYSSGYGLRLPPDEVEGELLGGLQQYPAATHTAPPDNADEGWITPPEETPDETNRNKGEGSSPPESDTVELPPTPPAEEPPQSFSGKAYIPWVPVRYQDQSLNEPKPVSPQDLLAGFGRMGVRDAPPHQGGRGEGKRDSIAFDRNADNAAEGWSEPRKAGQTWNSAQIPTHGQSDAARHGCYECGDEGHMARECPIRVGRGGGGISKFGVGNECRRCGQEGHWAKECTSGGGFECYNCGQTGHMSRDCLEPRKTQREAMSVKCYNCQGFGHISRECPGSQGGDAMDEDPREDAATTKDEGWGFKASGTAIDDDGWGSTPIPDPAPQVNSRDDGWTPSAIPNGYGNHHASAGQSSVSPEPVVARAPIGMHPDRARRLGAPVREEPRATNGFAPRDHPSQASPAPLLQPRSSTAARPPPPAPTPAEDDEFGGW